ncbi:PAS domain S-box protein [candidate division KSB1 bacterium]|nr:PAS domain S-box protein [candidate division KSB1 bacterium]
MDSGIKVYNTRIGFVMLIVITTLMLGNLAYLRLTSMSWIIPNHIAASIDSISMTLSAVLFLFSIRLIVLKRSIDYIYLMLIATIPVIWLLVQYIIPLITYLPVENSESYSEFGLPSLVSASLIFLASLYEGSTQSRKKIVVHFFTIILTVLLSFTALAAGSIYLVRQAGEVSRLNQIINILSALIALIALINYARRYRKMTFPIYGWLSAAALFLLLSIISHQLSRAQNDLYELVSSVNKTLFVISLVWATFEEHTRFFHADLQMRRSLEDSLFSGMKKLDMYALILNGMDTGIFTTDQDGFITYANDSFSKLIGITSEGLKGKNMEDLFDRKNLELLSVEREKWKSGQSHRFEIELKRRDGRAIPVDITALAVKNRFGIYNGGRFTVQESSERKEYEKEMKSYTQNLKSAIESKTSELRKRDEEYRSQQVFYESLISTINDILIVVDLQGNCTYINEHGRKILGYEAKELSSKRLPSFLADMEEMHRKFSSSFNFVIRNHEAVITTRNRMNLLCRWDVRPLIGVENRMIGIICLGRDVTDQKELENRLADYEQNLGMLVDQRTKELGQNVSQLEEILRVDEDVILNIDLPHALANIAQTIHNRGWKRVVITLMPDLRIICHKGIPSKNFTQFIVKHDPVLKHTLDFLHQRFQIGRSYYVTSEDGKKTDNVHDQLADGLRMMQKWSHDDALIVPIKFKRKLLGFIIVFDPSKSARLESEANRVLEMFAQKAAVVIENVNLYETLKARTRELESLNKTKSDFFANIAHEFRTPLTSILSLSSALLKKMAGELNHNQIHQLQIIKRNGEQLLKLINDNLNLSRMEAGKMEVSYSYFSLKGKINTIVDTIKPLCDRKKLKFEVSIARDVPEFIFSDEDKIDHVLMNLLSNAVKFCDRGKITFQVSHEKSKHSLKFIIRDSGIGMDRDEIDKIFQPYSQTDRDHRRKGTGSGLGLAIVKNYWEMLDGEISVQSKKGKGTLFTLLLPMQADRINVITEKAFTSEVPKLKKADNVKILIVDDNVDNQYALKFILNDIGYRLIIADSGEDGVKKAIKEKPALILMDMMMPGMDGYEATRAIKSNQSLRHIPVIAMTARTKQEDKNRAIEAGCVDYLSKPFSSDQIIRKVGQWIRS